MYRNELPLEPRHLVVPSGASKTISESMVRLVQTMHRRLHYLQTETREIPHDPCHQGAPSGACKMISEPMVHLVQTVHLSCVKITTISKQTEVSFHLRLITMDENGSDMNEYH